MNGYNDRVNLVKLYTLNIGNKFGAENVLFIILAVLY
jgi:hypothetical protein